MNELIDTILAERQWSWSVIGLLVILIGLGLRSLLLRNILHAMKVRNISWYKRTLSHYQKRSIIGWCFFSLCIIGITLFWTLESLLLTYFSLMEWMLIFVLLFSLSVFFHARAFAESIVEAMQDHVATDKEL